MNTANLKLRKQDQVAWIQIDRPTKLNAINKEVLGELHQVFFDLQQDNSIRVIVLTGSGEKAFVAGADIAEFSEFTPSQGKELSQSGQDNVFTFIEQMNKPVIAAINGPAVGVGVTMTLPMDIRLASKDAKFGFVFARRGLVPEAASSWFLPRLVGISKALEWTYSGRVFSSEEALEGGLVRSIHEPDELLTEAKNIAKEIIENTSSISVSLTRQMLWKMLGADHPMEAHKVDSRFIYELGRGNDAKEGVNSFLEKRPPEFPNKVSKDMPDYYPWWDEKEFS